MGCIYLILQVLFNSFYGITVGLVILIYILFFASLLTMSIRERNVILQIIPCQVCVNDSVSFGNRLFMPYLQICASGSCNEGI